VVDYDIRCSREAGTILSVIFVVIRFSFCKSVV
jgi:hypothetical protein